MSRLFRRAILLDGTALSPWALTEGPQEYLMQVATNLSVGVFFYLFLTIFGRLDLTLYLFFMTLCDLTFF
jgi:hypothetical protein